MELFGPAPYSGVGPFSFTEGVQECRNFIYRCEIWWNLFSGREISTTEPEK